MRQHHNRRSEYVYEYDDKNCAVDRILNDGHRTNYFFSDRFMYEELVAALHVRGLVRQLIMEALRESTDIDSGTRNSRPVPGYTGFNVIPRRFDLSYIAGGASEYPSSPPEIHHARPTARSHG